MMTGTIEPGGYSQFRMALRRRVRQHADDLSALRLEEGALHTLADAIPQLVWIAQRDGRFTWFNRRWFEYTGLSFRDVFGYGWQQVLHPDDLDRALDRELAAFGRYDAWEDTVRLRRADGEYRWFLSRAVPIRNRSGANTRWFGTCTDITERMESELERERLLHLEQEARERAERAARARDEVLAVVAHDLRNPLHTIQLLAHSMVEVHSSPEARSRQAGSIQRVTQSMDRQIGDLLDIARMEAGSFAIRKAPVDLRRLLDDTMAIFGPQIQEGELTVVREDGPDLGTVDCDRDQMLRVLSNLLANAIKFTPPNGSITLRSVRTARHLEVAVEDSGPGIAAENLEHVFDRFWQADRKGGFGTGLGLAIAKHIVEAHGGTIHAESAVGRGTTFSFLLPA
jgi:PAS domain S-box-containing protein